MYSNGCIQRRSFGESVLISHYCLFFFLHFLLLLLRLLLWSISLCDKTYLYVFLDAQQQQEEEIKVVSFSFVCVFVLVCIPCAGCVRSKFAMRNTQWSDCDSTSDVVVYANMELAYPSGHFIIWNSTTINGILLAVFMQYDDVLCMVWNGHVMVMQHQSYWILYEEYKTRLIVQRPQ